MRQPRSAGGSTRRVRVGCACVGVEGTVRRSARSVSMPSSSAPASRPVTLAGRGNNNERRFGGENRQSDVARRRRQPSGARRSRRRVPLATTRLVSASSPRSVDPMRRGGRSRCIDRVRFAIVVAPRGSDPGAEARAATAIRPDRRRARAGESDPRDVVRRGRRRGVPRGAVQRGRRRAERRVVRDESKDVAPVGQRARAFGARREEAGGRANGNRWARARMLHAGAERPGQGGGGGGAEGHSLRPRGSRRRRHSRRARLPDDPRALERRDATRGLERRSDAARRPLASVSRHRKPFR